MRVFSLPMPCGRLRGKSSYRIVKHTPVRFVPGRGKQAKVSNPKLAWPEAPRSRHARHAILRRMKCLAGSILVLSGAIALGAAQLAQSLARSGGWNDTPISMRVIGGFFCTVGLMVIAATLTRDRDANRLTIISGAVLVLAGTVVLASAKLALAIDYPAGRTEKPIAMLVIGTALSLAGLATTLRQAIIRRPPPNEHPSTF